MFIQVGRGFGKASDLLEPNQIARLQKVGGKIESNPAVSPGGGSLIHRKGIFWSNCELERLRGRSALYHYPLAIEIMCRFLILAINARPKTCEGCMGNDGDFDIVGHHLDIPDLAAMRSSSPLD